MKKLHTSGASRSQSLFGAVGIARTDQGTHRDGTSRQSLGISSVIATVLASIVSTKTDANHLRITDHVRGVSLDSTDQRGHDRHGHHRTSLFNGARSDRQGRHQQQERASLRRRLSDSIHGMTRVIRGHVEDIGRISSSRGLATA